jgi:hypothetical protein
MIPVRKPKVLVWTAHSRMKLRFYKFSESRIRRVIHSPKRVEEGIAPKTIALMQSSGTPKNPYEIWVMIQEETGKRKVISAWRYPGTTKPGQPLPAEIMRELRNVLN